LFDFAYQGFATGDCDEDAFSVRHFFDRGFDMAISQSFAKNMGLYGERTGAMHIVCKSKETRDRISSQLKIKIRASYSNPPIHGARLASRILSDPVLCAEWKKELSEVTGRLINIRALLRKSWKTSELQEHGTISLTR
jgi:aspartate aminotransferase